MSAPKRVPLFDRSENGPGPGFMPFAFLASLAVQDSSSRRFYERGCQEQTSPAAAAGDFAWHPASRLASEGKRCFRAVIELESTPPGRLRFVPFPSSLSTASLNASSGVKPSGLYWQPGFYLRLEAYSFMGLSEGAYSLSRDSVPGGTLGLTAELILSLEPGRQKVHR